MTIALLILILSVAAVWALWPKPPQPPARMESIAELDAYLESLTAFGTPPALSVAVVRDGETVYDKGFGLADGPRRIRADARTNYHWWSVTKLATATAILQLQEEGRLTLDDPVADHLGWFQVEYPSATSRTVTIRQLLNHSAGVADLSPIDLFQRVHAYGEPPVNQTEFAQRVFPAYRKLVFEPGSQATYTNYGYILLGAVIEAVSGESYEEYVRARILRPLRMDHTDFVYSEEMAVSAALGSHPLLNVMTPLIPLMLPDWQEYVRETSGGRMWFHLLYTDYTPSTGLIGPPSDSVRLLQVFLGDGSVDGVRILSLESIAEIDKDPLEGKGTGPAMQFSGLRHGLGWWILDRGGRTCWEHTGGGMGYATAVRIYPGEGLGIAVFTNDMTSDVETLLTLLASFEWRLS